MLEGAVARVLNQLLGKYVADLDTENFNVGIFSGKVQLTDLKLKPEALYELNVPIEVRTGTIGKIWLQIPWNALWTQSIVVNVEDVHLVVNPIVGNEPFDAEKNKRLLRGFKKSALGRLENGHGILGGPSAFAEHLLTTIISYLQLNITNVHVRYEDEFSWRSPISAGLCIGSITAQTTNSKWKRSSYDPGCDKSYYQVKIEALSVYWNTEKDLKKWNLPSEYYQWRNSMVKSLQTYSLDGEPFRFVVNPMLSKIRITTTKTKSGHVSDIHTEIIVQDFNAQISKEQYESASCVVDYFNRMLVSWQFLSKRPAEKVMDNLKTWWRYALWATLEQRVRPLTWSRMKRVREHYKQYMETYRQIIANPNDTELKLDLQKHEDNLSLINVIIARQHTRLLLHSRSVGEKSLWSLLPTPEKTALCEKIGYPNGVEGRIQQIDHHHEFKLGNFNLTLSSKPKEVLVATMTQAIFSIRPNFSDNTYSASLKIEGIIIEGNGPGGNMISIISSEHLKDSPAFFFKTNLEKMREGGRFSHRLQMALDSVECIYNKQAFEELEAFLQATRSKQRYNLLKYLQELPTLIYEQLKKKMKEKWDMNLNIKLPYIVVPESSSCAVSDNLLVLDLGRYTIRTDICQHTKVCENSTQMELEEQFYSKLLMDCADFQILFCDKNDHWKDARREKDTEMHVIAKTAFSSVYALSVLDLPTLPKLKFNVTFNIVKMNVSEKKLGLLLKFFDIDQIRINVITEAMQPDHFITDTITAKWTTKYMRRILNNIRISDPLKYRKHKLVNGTEQGCVKTDLEAQPAAQNMNEAWARMVDLPGLEDNISPSNNIQSLFGTVINEFNVVFSKSSDSTNRQYLILRLGRFNMDVAFMTYGPAYQMSIHNVLLTDKLHTTPSGQYLDLIYTPMPNNADVVTVLYRKVGANCPDFWTHFHGVETSLVANFGSVYLLLHQEAVHTLIKYSKYLTNKIKNQMSNTLKNLISGFFGTFYQILHKPSNVPVPPGSVKFSQSARLTDLNVTVCNSDFDIISVQLSGLEMDFLFRANERFVFRSFLSSINVDHMSQLTLYSRVLYTDEDKVFEVKYVRNAQHIRTAETIDKNAEEHPLDGSFKFQLGRINCIFLYKLMVQLQRFVINLEALDFMEKYAKVLRRTVKAATDTLKNKTKISLSINVCGPVLLIPQKSSSPNVLVIDTGNLRMENFFKETDGQLVENVLVKLKDVLITRGVMTLNSTLEMQETLIEPLCLNMDIKKYTNTNTAQKTWDVDGVMEKVEVTLGQKDLSMMMAIYTENIGEANIVDLFPEQAPSPMVEIMELDSNVRDLEAFFCEPKQKYLVARCKIDEVKIILFFDAGELLSSPIRDLNHGLCKLEIIDIDASVVAYTEESLDGKLSVDKISIEEIGPDANIHNKIVLSSPAEDGRNNNICNITVNKPPIVDVTFHQNKSGDRSIDVIVGRMCLSLSIPFCEKVALYVLECFAKDSQEKGIINKGYEGDTHCFSPTKGCSGSLTLSVRVNKPELMFLVETTSNKKRYFVTKSEIMIDLSRHSNRENLVMSFSGLHTLFYDLNEYSDQPYVTLKHCDVEVSKCIEEDNQKITLSISGVYVKLASEIIHSINDILNDIVEHFKIPEVEVDRTERREKSQAGKEFDDLWEPKKIEPYINKSVSTHQGEEADRKSAGQQSLIIPKFEGVVIFELDDVQIFLFKTTMELSIFDWNSLVHCTSEISLQANYFNENVQSWEPLIDPVVTDEKRYRPWECQVKIFQDKSMPINDIVGEKVYAKSSSSSISKAQKASRSYTTTEDEDSGEDMMYLEPVNSTNFGNNRRVKTSLSTFLDDSDSENDEDALEKLAAAITDLFTGDWNEHEDSEADHSSDDENEVTECSKVKEQMEVSSRKCLYVLINAKDHLNITITPACFKVFNEAMSQYSSKIISVKFDTKSISVINDIGPQTRVELYEKGDKVRKDLLVVSKKFENEESAPNSPTRNFDCIENVVVDRHLKQDVEQAYDFPTIRSLKFPPQSTAELYDKINRHFVRIFVPGFTPVQTNCSKRNWEKLVKLQNPANSVSYYLAVKHSIDRLGRNFVIGSPLQIKNETCLALSILYQPSILQQMNLEPVGEVTNPFETTMRIAVIEAHEVYNVPLYIAYHCKLFIQPAHAEGRYVPDSSGVWWRDMANEMDTAYNLVCRPKKQTDLEPFALRVALRKNVETINSHAHSVPNYVVRLLPPLVVHNFLPYTLEVENVALRQAVKAEPGENCSVYSLDLSVDHKLAIKITYDSLAWTGHMTVTGHLDEKIVLMISDQKDEIRDLSVNVKCEREGSFNLIFYAPYWIVNKTGLPLKIKASSSHSIHECPNDDILLFTYKRHCKQTLNVRVYESNWSNDFGVECSGTTGLIVCKDNERKKKYLFFLNTSLSTFCPRLTKIITILPSFLVINNTDRALRFMEYNERTDLWIDLEVNQTLVFWPETSSMQIHVKYKESKVISQPFFVSCHHKTVLRMDKGTAITVDVTGGVDGPFRVTFKPYRRGDAPVLIKNYCADVFLKIQQQDQSPVTLMSPNNSLLYTWDDPSRPRHLSWNVYNNKGSGFLLDITKNSYGEEKIKFHSVTPTTGRQESSSSEDDSDSSNSTPKALNKKIRRDKIIIYWASFKEGRQQILLFTQEQRIFDNILETRFHEQSHLETVLSLAGVELSVFTSEADKKEHVHACLADTPAVWEVNVGQKWKTLTLELASWIEDKYRRSATHKKCQIKDYVHIDFEKMFMLKPFFAEMRRTYAPALFCHFRKSSRFQYVDFRVETAQIDNKHSNCIVLQPVQNFSAPERHNAFAKVSIARQVDEDFDSYRYIKIDISNASVNVENDLWTKIVELWKLNKKLGETYSHPFAYVSDITSIRKSLTATKPKTSPICCRIEHLYLSGFGLQLNISNRVQMALLSDGTSLNRGLDHLFPYNMAPYMPLEGVHHKIASVEWVNLDIDVADALGQLAEQVAGQFLQQYYSTVLGLQVLMNTFAIQPAIEVGHITPQKNAETVSYGCKCVLGHVSMSPAAMETCIMDIFPSLNLDNLQTRPKRKASGELSNNELLKMVTASGKNFNVSVPVALAQLIVKNHNVSIQSDGEMFFKTTGKALFSLISRHPDEKTDHVELAREALRRASILGEPIRIHQRLTRYRNTILGLTPFSAYESMGEYLLETVGNSRFSVDTYWTHIALERTCNSIILVSLGHVIRINKHSLWGPWEVEWAVELDNIISLPKIDCVELTLNMRPNDSSTKECQIKISGPKNLLAWLHEKIEQAIIVSMEQKSWPLTDPQ
ncbi:intermembrane lipid transfer protein VPS13C-like isoform X2 [Cylas formicarius]|uniref:intermembrane lipid transfer protein VPS13C-like isoform X2 n=1 Tax=Cylas formicarius TaxID=197179 RepID=UPI0029583AE2|nr:intermembrane lipid transfer protein VPS13C-like isoform X2 [Cylas formicarius]